MIKPQDKLEEYADEVFAPLDQGGHIYFCGLKGMMPLMVSPSSGQIYIKKERASMSSFLRTCSPSSVPLSLTHTRTRSLSPSLPPSLPPSHFLSLSPVRTCSRPSAPPRASTSRPGWSGSRRATSGMSRCTSCRTHTLSRTPRCSSQAPWHVKVY